MFVAARNSFISGACLVVPSLLLVAGCAGVPNLGEVRYQLVFAAGSCTVAGPPTDAHEDGAADVRLETDYVTAVALSRGTANAQAALADGRLRVSGNVARLATHAAALSALDDLFAALRTTTSYPAP